MVVQQRAGQRVRERPVTARRRRQLTARVLCAGIRCLAPRFVGRRLSTVVGDFAATHRNFLGGQTRFMSPEVRVPPRGLWADGSAA